MYRILIKKKITIYDWLTTFIANTKARPRAGFIFTLINKNKLPLCPILILQDGIVLES